jgi:chromosome segregation ATPase
MRGWRIVWIFLLVAGLSGGYLLIPGEQDIRRAFNDIAPHEKDAEIALGDCKELLLFLRQRKSTERKKIELGELRARFEELSNEADELNEDGSVARETRLRRLDDLEARFWELKRDAEDLRARLREMKKFLEELTPVVANLGRRQRALALAQEDSADFQFKQRAGELIQQSKVARDLADQGMVRLATSIGQGRPIAYAALRDLEEIVGLMQEMVDSHSQVQGTPADGS